MTNESKAGLGTETRESTTDTRISSAPPPGLDADLQSILDAVTRLAEASVRPVIRTLRTVEKSVSDKTSPRIRLQGIASTSTDLVSTSLRLVEKIANLALDAVAGGQATQQTVQVPGAKPGAALRLPMAVENPTGETMTDLAFGIASLEGPAGTTLTRHMVKVVPARQTIQPGDFEKVVVLIDVPADAHAGVYSGALEIEGHKDVKVPFQFAVAKD